eukprot:TRINITY_DN3166_c0_g1_i1.p1 TRINITY_DN3166_c0_g1~~TRINITY_DN3166_c0_g1_i1.p1  ORF type:complete len:296 (+),score=109.81 TRINITY_DN3166_c0_g1_i1:86-973(+)
MDPNFTKVQKEIDQSLYTKFTCLRVDRNIDNESTVEVVLNRPKKLNTMPSVFFEEIGEVFELLDVDSSVNCIIIWAEGRMFTAGLDLKSAANVFTPDNNEDGKSTAEKNLEFLRMVLYWQQCFENIRQCRKPVIAAIHNKCIGGGVDLITACDIRYCTSDATFSVKETQIGIVADLGTLQRIEKKTSSGFAREMAFSGNDVCAKRALVGGLVNEVFENKEEMLNHVRNLANKISSNSPLVVQGTKSVLNFAETHSLEDSKLQVAFWNTALLKSDDVVEAVMSFMQKKKPKFRNRL